ncbi:MAG: glycosyltransferase [Actinomycetota bacterium]
MSGSDRPAEVDVALAPPSAGAERAEVVGGRPARYDRRRPARPTVSVIVPSYNERENINELLPRLGLVLADLDHEIVVVDDDSPDRTWEAAENLAADNPRIQVIRRVGRRGLSSAVIEGMTVARGRVLAVIDADLQHDETKLPDLVSAIIDDGAEVSIGTRESDGGSYGTWGPGRRLISRAGAQLAHVLLGVEVSDPMTGFFAVSRPRFDAIRRELDPQGFKIGLEMLARGDRPVVAEVGYEFRTRSWGETKLSGGVVIAYLWSVVGLAVARLASIRFATYAIIAVTGLSMRLSLLSMLDWVLPGPLPALVSFAIAGLFEFGLHERITFADRLRRRRRSAIGRLTLFHLVLAQSGMALSGTMALLENHRSSLGLGAGLTFVLLTSTVSVIATIALAFVTNGALTWPAGGRG